MFKHWKMESSLLPVQCSVCVTCKQSTNHSHRLRARRLFDIAPSSGSLRAGPSAGPLELQTLRRLHQPKFLQLLAAGSVVFPRFCWNALTLVHSSNGRAKDRATSCAFWLKTLCLEPIFTNSYAAGSAAEGGTCFLLECLDFDAPI